jgi:hypothetical protein
MTIGQGRSRGKIGGIRDGARELGEVDSPINTPTDLVQGTNSRGTKLVYTRETTKIPGSYHELRGADRWCTTGKSWTIPLSQTWITYSNSKYEAYFHLWMLRADHNYTDPPSSDMG